MLNIQIDIHIVLGIGNMILGKHMAQCPLAMVENGNMPESEMRTGEEESGKISSYE